MKKIVHYGFFIWLTFSTCLAMELTLSETIDQADAQINNVALSATLGSLLPIIFEETHGWSTFHKTVRELRGVSKQFNRLLQDEILFKQFLAGILSEVDNLDAIKKEYIAKVLPIAFTKVPLTKLDLDMIEFALNGTYMPIKSTMDSIRKEKSWEYAVVMAVFLTRENFDLFAHCTDEMLVDLTMQSPAQRDATFAARMMSFIASLAVVLCEKFPEEAQSMNLVNKIIGGRTTKYDEVLLNHCVKWAKHKNKQQQMFEDGLASGIFNEEDQNALQLVLTGTDEGIKARSSIFTDVNRFLVPNIVAVLLNREFVQTLVALANIDSYKAIISTSMNELVITQKWHILRALLTALPNMSAESVSMILGNCLMIAAAPPTEIMELIVKKLQPNEEYASQLLALLLAFVQQEAEKVRDQLAIVARAGDINSLLGMLVLPSMLRQDAAMLAVIKQTGLGRYMLADAVARFPGEVLQDLRREFGYSKAQE
jgi:hypothetical protein